MTIEEWKRRHKRHRGRPSQSTRDASIRYLHRHGVSAKALAKQFGRSLPRIYQILNRCPM